VLHVYEPLVPPDAVALTVAPVAADNGLTEHVGAVGAALTLTTTLFVTEPPAPVHDIENVVCDVRLLDASLPPVALPVENPAPPVAVHDVAFVDVHVSVVGLPEFTGFGDAVSVAVGAGAA
jgi:hypothetical protein